MVYLKEIGYDGPFSFELLRTSFPESAVRETLSYLYSVGRSLLDMAR